MDVVVVLLYLVNKLVVAKTRRLVEVVSPRRHRTAGVGGGCSDRRADGSGVMSGGTTTCLRSWVGFARAVTLLSKRLVVAQTHAAAACCCTALRNLNLLDTLCHRR